MLEVQPYFDYNNFLPGYECVDIDECDLIRPCDDIVSCRNTAGGFICGPCPPGFEGSSGWTGAGNERHKERCVDIDECDGRVSCPRGRLCINTPVREYIKTVQFKINNYFVLKC